MKNLKSLLFTFVVTISMFMVSCNNEFDSQNPISDNEKVAMINELFKSYGWEKDESMSDAERESLYRKADYNQIKTMLEELKKDWKFETIRFEQSSGARGINAFQTWFIEGEHKNAITNTTISHIDFKFEPPTTSSATIIGSSIKASVGLQWTPGEYNTFSFSGERCDMSLKGKVKYLGQSYDKEMKGYVIKNVSTGMMKEGKIESFH